MVVPIEDSQSVHGPRKARAEDWRGTSGAYTVSFMDDHQLVSIAVTLTPSLIHRLDERRKHEPDLPDDSSKMPWGRRRRSGSGGPLGTTPSTNAPRGFTRSPYRPV